MRDLGGHVAGVYDGGGVCGSGRRFAEFGGLVVAFEIAAALAGFVGIGVGLFVVRGFFGDLGDPLDDEGAP